MIGRAGVGVDNVDVEAATRRGIVVANAPESTVVSAAEHTIGLLVALARNIPQAHAALKQGRWERSRCGGIELADKTLGVLGFGRIGQQVARRALGLGMRVVAYDPFVVAGALPRARRRARRDAGGASTPPRTSSRSTCRSTDETRGSIDATAFATMRDGVRIVNAARGELVDEDGARRGAPQSGKVAGAALDVFSSEPYSGPAARARQRRRHAAPRRVDRGGAGPRRRDRRRAGRGGARGRARHERRQHPGDRRGGPRGARRRSSRSRRSSGGSRWSSPAGAPTRIELDVLRRARRVRHAPAHRRRAERRLPGARRPAGQLRERAAGRGRARDRGARGAPPRARATSRTSSASRVARTARRCASPGTTIGRENRPLARRARSASSSRWSSRR